MPNRRKTPSKRYTVATASRTMTLGITYWAKLADLMESNLTDFRGQIEKMIESDWEIKQDMMRYHEQQKQTQQKIS